MGRGRGWEWQYTYTIMKYMRVPSHTPPPSHGIDPRQGGRYDSGSQQEDPLIEPPKGGSPYNDSQKGNLLMKIPGRETPL